MSLGRPRPRVCGLAAVLGVSFALLSGCASLSPGARAAGSAPPEALPREAPRRPPAPGVDPETLDRWGEAKAKRYAGYLDRSVLPLVAEDITGIKRKGYIDSVGEQGLDHVHLRYGFLPSGSAVTHVRSAGDWDHLHYHGLEYLPGAVASWREELIGAASGEMKYRLAENRRTQFDYKRFFYGDGSYDPPPAISREALKSYARTWWKQQGAPGDRPADEGYRTLVDRLILVIGAEQPGYHAAAARILARRSLVASRRTSAPTPTKHRFLGGYYHPVTIYFGPGYPYAYHVRIRRVEQLETP
ncbi:MAG: hypothetical protein ACOC4A_02275 [Spirochaetota bacterium]